VLLYNEDIVMSQEIEFVNMIHCFMTLEARELIEMRLVCFRCSQTVRSVL